MNVRTAVHVLEKEKKTFNKKNKHYAGTTSKSLDGAFLISNLFFTATTRVNKIWKVGGGSVLPSSCVLHSFERASTAHRTLLFPWLLSFSIFRELFFIIFQHSLLKNEYRFYQLLQPADSKPANICTGCLSRCGRCFSFCS